MTPPADPTYVAKVLHLFAGLGGGAIGFQRARDTYRGLSGRYEVIGAVDNDPAACRDFEYFTGVPATCADMHEMTPAELRAACGGRCPDAIFTSPPCKGFSGLLSEAKSKTEHYQRLNRLVIQGLWLAMEAFADARPAMILLENVPRIAKRGRSLLDQVQALLTRYGYVFDEGFHDCGEIAGLGQRRRRFLMVARLKSRVPNYLHKPPKKNLRTIGDVLGPLPMPEDPSAGALHKLPALEWRTWVRLALIPAGGDWRDLDEFSSVVKKRKKRANGETQSYKSYGVVPWDQTAATVTSSSGEPGSGPHSVADPRPPAGPKFNNTFRVVAWDEPSVTITGGGSPSASGVCVADKRYADPERPAYGVAAWDEPAATVTGARSPGQGKLSVADPRACRNGMLGVKAWDETAGTVTGESWPTNGANSVADPRLTCQPRSGTMGVVAWNEPSPCVVSRKSMQSGGAAAVADPRIPGPREKPSPAPVIIARDGTWHRPITAYEMAALQSLPLVVRGKPLQLDGKSQSGWRERIGNAVPPAAAEAIACAILRTLIVAQLGGFELSSEDVWVLPENEDDPRLGVE